MLVFVYGTLTDPERAAAVLDDWSFRGDATLSGLHRVDGEYPTLAPGGHVEGRVLETEEVDRLDAYEGVDSGLYVRVDLPLRDDRDRDRNRDRDRVDAESVAVYVGDPARLGVDVEWPGEGSFEERVGGYVAENEVVVRPRDRQR